LQKTVSGHGENSWATHGGEGGHGTNSSSRTHRL